VPGEFFIRRSSPSETYYIPKDKKPISKFLLITYNWTAEIPLRRPSCLRSGILYLSNKNKNLWQKAFLAIRMRRILSYWHRKLRRLCHTNI